VVYARGLDPDQDVYAGGGYVTKNTIASGNLVYGSAPITDWTIGIFSDSPYSHVPSIRADWSSDPYSLLTPRNDGDGDYTINMVFDIGTLGAGQSANVDFQYRIAETGGGVSTVPEPCTIIVWSLLGAGSWLGMRVWRKPRSIGRRPWSPETRNAIHEIIARGNHPQT